MKALILTGGRGVNLNPFTLTRPKSMVYVGGRYLLDNQINLLEKAGVNDIQIIVGHHKEKIIDHYSKTDIKDTNIHLIHQDNNDNIGNAILQAKDKFNKGEYFLLIYGDVLVASNIFSKTLLSFHNFKTSTASICLPPSSKMFGNVFLDGKMNITKVVEKPEKKDDMGSYVLAGVFVLSTSLFDILEDHGGSMEDALSELVKRGELKASIWEEDWVDICYPWNILEANKIIMDSWSYAKISSKAVIENNVTINGPVVIEDDVFIKSGAVIDGPAFIGKGTYIGNRSLIRQYASLGPSSMVGFGVELKNCVIFGNSKIGRLSFIGDSVLGEYVELGANTVTVNRALDYNNIKVNLNNKLEDTGLPKLGTLFGDNVKIGASYTFKEGTIIQPNLILNSNISFTEG